MAASCVSHSVLNGYHQPFGKNVSVKKVYKKLKKKLGSKMALYKKMTKKSLTSEMDRSVKRMLKLIEEEGDSFAKKAEMYYQKRPELISHVEEFYRMYRSLAERYDHLTGEVRKNIPSDLQSQGSGISDVGSDTSSALGITKKLPRRKSGPRAAGFEFFLGSGGGSSDVYPVESDESLSSSSSDSDSDDESSKNSFTAPPVNDEGAELRKRVIELEVELREMKERFRLAEAENSNALSKGTGNGNYDELLGRITWYEEELKVSNERLKVSEQKVARLKVELKQVLELQEQTGVLENKVPDQSDKVRILEKQLTTKNQKLEASVKETGRLKLELDRRKASEAIRDLQNELELENSRIRGLEAEVVDGERGAEALEEEQNIRSNKLRIAEEIARLKVELEKSEMTTELVINLTDPINAIETLEKELTLTNKKLKVSEEEIARLKLDLEKARSSDADRDIQVVSERGSLYNGESGLESEASFITSVGVDVTDRDYRIEDLNEELSIINKKLQLSEEEIARLKVELAKNEDLITTNASFQAELESANASFQAELESARRDIEIRDAELEKNVTLLATNASLQAELESARRDIKRREAEVQSEKNRVLELQKQIIPLESNVADQQHQIESAQKDIKMREMEFESQKKRVFDLQEQIRRLESSIENQTELVSAKNQILDLQEQIIKLESNVVDQQAQLEFARKDIKTREMEFESEKSRVLDLQEQVIKLESNVVGQQAQLESARKDIEMREVELKSEKTRVLDLQEQIMKLESNVVDQQAQLESAQKDTERSETELESEKTQISHLQELVIELEGNVTVRDEEIEKLKASITEAENNFSLEKCKLQEEVSGLSDSCDLLEARLKELDLKVQSLEEEIKRVETEKSEIHLSFVTNETGLKSEIEHLKADIAERYNNIQELTKSLDALRLRYDRQTLEKDDLNAKILALEANVVSKDDCIHEMDEHLHQLHMEHVELISGSEAARKLVHELESKMKALEEEVHKQRVMISEAAEEKREAIRQLCFSLEYYKNRYSTLRQALLVHKLPTSSLCCV